MSISHVYGGYQRGNARACDPVQVRTLVSSWEPCPEKHHLILAYIFLRLLPFVLCLICKYFISSFQEE